MVENDRAGSATTIRFAVVDRHPLLRAGVVHALQGTASCVAQGVTAADAMAIPGRQAVDILIADVFAIAGGGFQLLSDMKRCWPAVGVVVLTSDEGGTAAAGAMQSGALGFVTKDADCQELRAAVAAVKAGGSYVSPMLGARLLASGFTSTPGNRLHARAPVPASELTPRELQILSQVSLGATNREIANTLSITEKTVKHYMTSIMQKLGVRNRVEAVVALRDRKQASA